MVDNKSRQQSQGSIRTRWRSPWVWITHGSQLLLREQSIYRVQDSRCRPDSMPKTARIRTRRIDVAGLKMTQSSTSFTAIIDMNWQVPSLVPDTNEAFCKTYPRREVSSSILCEPRMYVERTHWKNSWLASQTVVRQETALRSLQIDKVGMSGNDSNLFVFAFYFFWFQGTPPCSIVHRSHRILPKLPFVRLGCTILLPLKAKQNTWQYATFFSSPETINRLFPLLHFEI